MHNLNNPYTSVPITEKELSTIANFLNRKFPAGWGDKSSKRALKALREGISLEREFMNG